MRIVPDSTITLYSNIPITADNDEQLVFQSLANQASYFSSHKVVEKVNCQIVKKTGRLRVHVPASTVKTCNYLSFVNPSWDNKTFYCKIRDYNYINNETVEIAYSIDMFQTWMFDVSYSDMFIEREHLSEADYQKAETNPYDPTIYEFRTSEELPFGKDTEKLYYNITDKEFQPTDNYDGFLVGEAIKNKYSVPWVDVGVLVVLSDINFENLQDGSLSVPGQNTADQFGILLSDLISNGSSTSFYEISNTTQSTLANTYNISMARAAYGSAWSSFPGVGNLYPMGTSRIDGPNTYIFFGNAASSSGGPDGQALGSLLHLLTRWSLLDNLVAMYCIPSGLMMCSGAAGYSILSASLTSAKNQNVRNKKLDLFPYSYYRLIAPNGDVKELRMEDFKDLQEGRDYAPVGFSLDCISSPQLYAGPIDYKMDRAGNGANMNIQETLVFSQFPTMPYSIDGYTAHLAAVANSIIGNNTTEYGLEMENKQLGVYEKYADAYGGLAQGGLGVVQAFLGGNIASGVSNIVSGAKNSIFGGAQADLMQKQFDIEAKQSEDAYDYIRGSEKNAITGNYQYTKPAYAGSIYHQSDGNGMSNFMRCSFVDIIFMKVTLNPTILAEYDKYFDCFGYTSGRCGMPRAINYINGSSGPASLPHWHTVNGHYTTYVKTKNCKVDYAMEPVSQGIKAIFDNGVRLIKGD